MPKKSNPKTKAKRRPAPPDLAEAIGDVKQGQRTRYLLDTGISSRPGDVGATGSVGMPEVILRRRRDAEDTTEMNNVGLPSDLRDVGDPEAGDQGVPGGLAAGGSESLGGSGGAEPDRPDTDQTLDQDDFIGMSGTGNINPEAHRGPVKKKNARSGSGKKSSSQKRPGPRP